MRAFWPEPISVFGSSMLTMPVAVHICWTYHSARPSHRLDAGSVRKPLTGSLCRDRQRALVSAALDPAVISYADADRLLRTELQVQLHEFSRVEPSFKRLQVAPGLSSRFLTGPRAPTARQKMFPLLAVELPVDGGMSAV
jgi:hypothetical protein